MSISGVVRPEQGAPPQELLATRSAALRARDSGLVGLTLAYGEFFRLRTRVHSGSKGEGGGGV